jgi:hypothetical protein
MSPLRNGNFTSGEIAALLNPRTAATYVEEKNMERRLGRSISAEVDARPTGWGKVLERRAFDILGLDYQLTSDVTLKHPTIDCWYGSPDGFHHNREASHKAVIDFKAPWTLKSFCTLVDAWEKGGILEIRDRHRDGEKYYQQLVSNACIAGVKWAELIVYMPYESELDAIRHSIEGEPEYYWLWTAPNDKLPYLIEGGHYKNINVMRFEVPSLDKATLHDAVVKYSKELITVKPALQYDN